MHFFASQIRATSLAHLFLLDLTVPSVSSENNCDGIHYVKVASNMTVCTVQIYKAAT
jgi:hypothetical protein